MLMTQIQRNLGRCLVGRYVENDLFASKVRTYSDELVDEIFKLVVLTRRSVAIQK